MVLLTAIQSVSLLEGEPRDYSQRKGSEGFQFNHWMFPRKLMSD